MQIMLITPGVSWFFILRLGLGFFILVSVYHFAAKRDELVFIIAIDRWVLELVFYSGHAGFCWP